MKLVIALATLGLIASCASSNKKSDRLSNENSASSPQLAWEVKEGIDTPECVYYDEATKTIFVSNIAGAPDKQDGMGWITTLDENGKIKDKQWVSGLSAPKGMRSHNGVLWVSDINRVHAFDIKTKRKIHSIKINSAKFLNDIAIDSNGKVFVSDTFANRIFTITNGKVVGLFLQGTELESPNGLLIKGNTLYMSSWGQEMKKDWSVKVPGNLFAIDLKTKKKNKITKVPLGNLDGLEMKNDSFLISDWMKGTVYEVSATGESKVILEGLKNSADIAYLKEANLLIVPSMGGNKLSAYKY